MAVTAVKGRIEINSAPFGGQPGGMCAKGWTAGVALSEELRLTTPMLRVDKNAQLFPCSWDEAYNFIEERIRQSQAQFGKDSVGIFGGGGLTNEKAYYLGKFARVALSTRFIDYNGRFCMSSAAAALNRSFGIDRGLPFPLSDIAKTDVLMLVGSNIAETMPPAMRYIKELQDNGGKLIVVDPRRTPTARLALLHLPIVPASDLALANGILHIAIEEKYIDEQFIFSNVENFSEVRETVRSFWPKRVEKITGISVSLLYQVAQILGEAKTAMIITARGAEQHSRGTDTTSAFLNLAVSLGKVAKPYCGFGTFTGQGNGQGGREHGQKADQLPGYRSIENAEHRSEVARVWDVDPLQLPGAGVSAQEMFENIGHRDGIRVMMIMGSNPVISAPSSGFVQSQLGLLDTLIVVDPFFSDTAQLADVVLPSAQWAEETGTMTNSEGRIILRRRSVPKPPYVRTDLEIIAELAKRLGFAEKFTSDEERVFDELARASKGGKADYSGVSYKKIEMNDGVYWPCNEDYPNGRPRLFANKFATSNGKALLFAVDYKGPSEVPTETRPIYLITGRSLLQYQSGAQTRRIKDLDPTGPYVEMHPFLARRFEIRDGQSVLLTSDRGQAVMTAVVTPDIRSDTVFAPFHWPGLGRVNLLTGPQRDPISKMPEFKVCIVSLSAPISEAVL